jgi:hypothetical protein
MPSGIRQKPNRLFLVIRIGTKPIKEIPACALARAGV